MHTIIYWFTKKVYLNSIWSIVVRYFIELICGHFFWLYFLSVVRFLSSFLSFVLLFVRSFVYIHFVALFYGAQFACKTLFSLISNGIRLTLITSNWVCVYLSLCATTIIQKCLVACCYSSFRLFSGFLCFTHTLDFHLLFTGDASACNLCTFF